MCLLVKFLFPVFRVEHEDDVRCDACRLQPKELLPDMRELSICPRRISIIGFESVMIRELLSFSCPFHVAVLDAEFVEAGEAAQAGNALLCVDLRHGAFRLLQQCNVRVHFWHSPALDLHFFQQQLHVGSYGEGESRIAVRVL